MKVILICYVFLSYTIKTGEFKKIMIEERIINGKDALITDYPYQLSLLFNGLHRCGAALISNSAIVTAAHCVMHSTNCKYYSVRAGTTTVNSGGTVVGIKRIVSHSKFDKASMDYDIAIAILSRCLSFGPTVRSIKLVGAKEDLPVGTHVNATGWGTTYPGNTVLSTHLKSVELLVIAQNVCKVCYGPDVITSRMMCAGYLSGGKDTCQF
ncbi:hypothetical protein ILUMI_11900 [Ignelater luminosus]|uniref:Peptidase S1 domain-containing protein n=1 Tax=Ignelater luminosus TaxID=2038154 RepID=A0A8K0CZ99_IGNLU|nr:hypothetical protein ILUMI_11900 [Ignelater luminosus]